MILVLGFYLWVVAFWLGCQQPRLGTLAITIFTPIGPLLFVGIVLVPSREAPLLGRSSSIGLWLGMG